MQQNHPYLEKAVVGLWMTMESCLAFIEEHEHPEGMPCDCLTCDDMRGVLYMARNCESILTSQMIPLDAELQWLRQFGFPPAGHLVEMIRARFKPQDGSEEAA